MEADDHFTFTLPKLSGYKTIIVQAIIMALGAIAIFAPHALPVFTPEQIAAGVDTMTGAVAIVCGVVSLVLRLMSGSPVASPLNVLGVKAKGSDLIAARLAGFQDGHGEGYRLAMVEAHEVVQLAKAAHQPVKVASYDVGPASADAARLAGQLAAAMDAQKERNMKLARTMLNAQPAPAPVDQSGFVETIAKPEAPTSVVQHPAGMPVYLRSTIAAFIIPFLSATIVFTPIFTLAGCATVREVNSVAAADTIGQQAYAAYATFTGLEECAARLVVDKRVPARLRLAVQKADAVAKPAADSVQEALRSLQAAKAAYASASPMAGEIAPVEAATAVLNARLVALAAAMAQFTVAVTNASATLKV